MYPESTRMLMDFQKFLLECPDDLIDDLAKVGLRDLQERLTTISSPQETKNALAILKWFRAYPDLFEVFKWVTKDLAHKPPANSTDPKNLVEGIIKLIDTKLQTTEIQ